MKNTSSENWHTTTQWHPSGPPVASHFSCCCCCSCGIFFTDCYTLIAFLKICLDDYIFLALVRVLPTNIASESRNVAVYSLQVELIEKINEKRSPKTKSARVFPYYIYSELLSIVCSAVFLGNVSVVCPFHEVIMTWHTFKIVFFHSTSFNQEN